MWFEVINSIGRLFLTFIVIYKITQFRDTLSMGERLSLGVMGGGSFLTIPLIWDPHGPFMGWPVSALTYGALGFLWFRTKRDRKHFNANEELKDRATRHLMERGKL